MAGMLPGVECARRRRFHPNTNTIKDDHNPTITATLRHPLFYPTNFESLMLSSSSLKQRSHVLNDHTYREEHNLGGEAREAKQRLDDKFRAHWKFDHNPKKKGLFRALCRLHLR